MPQTISEAIGDDHKYIDYCHKKILEAPTTEDKVKWRNQIVWTFARHAISEELTMYPAMIEHLGEEGKKMTETDLEQHQAVRNIILDPYLLVAVTERRILQIKEDLYKLQSMSPEDSEFSTLLTRLMDDFHEHVEHESNEVSIHTTRR